MERCNECGKELNALNMSDVEPGMCGGCVDLALDFILKIGEDSE